MKIGIMTFWQAKENYGQILQLYALYSFFEERGHEPYLIRYDRLQGDKGSICRRLLDKIEYLFRPRRLFRILYVRIKFQKKGGVNDRGFQQFVNRYIKVTDRVYHSLVELQRYPPLADVYVCGSDQIWNQDKNSYSPAFFLDFGPDSVNRISYAASFGKKNITNNLAHKIIPLLKRFQLVTVREEEGVDICNRIGIKAYRTPDPTMIVGLDCYEKLLYKDKAYNSPYAMLYLLGHNTHVPFDEIYKWASFNSLQIRYVASDHRYDKYKKETPSINQWVQMVKNAKYIVTNSFHGTVFAILFNVPFVTLPLTGPFEAMNGRIRSLLKDYGLENRFLTQGVAIKDVLEYPIDFSVVNEITDQRRKNAISLLDSCVKI